MDLPQIFFKKILPFGGLSSVFRPPRPHLYAFDTHRLNRPSTNPRAVGTNISCVRPNHKAAPAPFVQGVGSQGKTHTT